jgi:hypothetical protein
MNVYTVTEKELKTYNEKSQQTTVVLLKNIKSIRLIFFSGQSFCTIVTENSKQSGKIKPTVITTRNYTALGEYTEQRQEYMAFLLSFHEKTVSANSKVRYICGSYFYLIFGIVLLLFSAIGAGLVFSRSGKPVPGYLLITLATVFLAGLSLILKGKQRDYRPQNLDEKTLLGIAGKT